VQILEAENENLKKRLAIILEREQQKIDKFKKDLRNAVINILNNYPYILNNFPSFLPNIDITYDTRPLRNETDTTKVWKDPEPIYSWDSTYSGSETKLKPDSKTLWAVRFLVLSDAKIVVNEAFEEGQDMNLFQHMTWGLYQGEYWLYYKDFLDIMQLQWDSVTLKWSKRGRMIGYQKLNEDKEFYKNIASFMVDELEKLSNSGLDVHVVQNFRVGNENGYFKWPSDNSFMNDLQEKWKLVVTNLQEFKEFYGLSENFLSSSQGNLKKNQA
jgi:hypothetical protein